MTPDQKRMLLHQLRCAYAACLLAEIEEDQLLDLLFETTCECSQVRIISDEILLKRLASKATESGKT